jgi:hypothetical protein
MPPDSGFKINDRAKKEEITMVHGAVSVCSVRPTSVALTAAARGEGNGRRLATAVLDLAAQLRVNCIAGASRDDY